MTDTSPLRLAAACIPIRDSGAGAVEVLMVRRNPDLSFGGLWTFPGGVLEDADGPLPPDLDEATQHWGDPLLLTTAANGAARETMEETALVCDVASLAWLSHWIPPLVGPPKRFATWFFLAPEHRGTLEVNPSENDDARWIGPSAALQACEQGEFPLTIPTWITLDDLQATSSIPLLIDRCISLGATRYHTRAIPSSGHRVMCWVEDAAYETGDAETPGLRNRVRATPSGSVIERIRS